MTRLGFMIIFPVLFLASMTTTAQARPALEVDVSSVKDGSVDVDFIATEKYGSISVNWYVNGQFKDSTRISLPRASIKINSLSAGQALEIKALEFYGQGEHWSKTFYLKAAPIVKPSLSVDVGRVKSGRVKLNLSARNKQGSVSVNWYVNGQYKDSARVNLPSASLTVADVEGGDQLEVKVLEFYGQGDHWSKKFQLRRDPSDIPNSKIRDYADQQARTVANKVAGTYGEYERWKYNFAKGYLEAYHRYQDQGAAYQRGRRIGQSEVGTAGTLAGQRAAKTMAARSSHAYADQRFTAVIGSDREPDTQLAAIEVPSYSPQLSRVPVPSIDAKLDDLNRRLQSEMYLLNWTYGNWTLDLRRDSQRLDIREVHKYHSIRDYRFLDGWFRSDYAYEEWKSNRLGGGYDHNVYNKLDIYQKNYFKGEFKKVYDAVIDAKFNRIKYTPSYLAYASGKVYGREVGIESAIQTGRSEGYKKVYSEDALASFPSQYEDSFEYGFAERVEFLNNNAVVKLGNVQVLDSKNSSSFESGDELKVVVTSLVNIGRKSANVNVSLNGSILEDSRDEQYVIKPFFRSEQRIEFENMARISSSAKQNVPYKISVAFGKYYNGTVSFTLSWSKRVEAFSHMSPSSSEYRAARAFILDQVKKEWLSCLEQSKNWYRVGIDSQTSTLMKQLADAHSALPANLRSNTRSLQDDLYKIRKMGSGWKYFRRSSFKKLIKKLK
ncbi:hypothetical protein N9D31_02390 [Oligoflexaceae bacterium]|nr:hypothetical protein [Oligoflexaceae bacterium]